MRKFKSEALIRDNRLDFFIKKGIKLNYSILNEKEYIKALKDKIVEEAIEIQVSENTEEIANEIVDVLEVMFYLKKVCGITEDEIKEKLVEKHEKMGGFEKRIQAHYVEIPDESEDDVGYYLKNPEKYPEIKD